MRSGLLFFSKLFILSALAYLVASDILNLSKQMSDESIDTIVTVTSKYLNS